ncbi:hypothetical protein DFH09DRAFT_1315072 [Mycena vulgaris]|nr:hypothetical protein DFH09DRAFT_1315072 [Mycena vulgaris]
MSSPLYRLARAPPSLYRTKPVDESQRQELGARFLPSRVFLIRCIGLITRPRAAARLLRGIFDRCRRTTNRVIFARESPGALFQVLASSSMKYMNALAPPFPPPVPNSISRRSKRLVLASLHVVLGVSASRPLALTLLDASTPMSREQRIHRAVAVAVARRRTTARCILEARTLGSRSVRLGKSRI